MKSKKFLGGTSFRFFAAKMLKNSFLLVRVYNAFYRLKNKKRFWKEMEKRTQMSIFDYKELVKPMPFYPIEFVADSNFYGQAYTMKRYAGVDKFEWSIEHGLYYDTYIPIASQCRTIERIMTFSNVRVKCMEGIKPAVAIGPYIHYAQPLLDEEDIKNLKKKLGKTLLFIPTHTNNEGGSEYNITNMAKELKAFQAKHHFDTVLVNVYYRDELLTQCGRLYEEAGFKVVTAGHQLDLNFLNRLKTILLLADYACSNSIGTHTGYCAYLNIPQLIINPAEKLENVKPLWRPLWLAFESDTKESKEKQKALVREKWGFDYIKSKEEMRSLLLNNRI